MAKGVEVMVGGLAAAVLGAQPLPPPPAWWLTQGAPLLQQVQDDIITRRNAPYLHERTYLDLASYRRRMQAKGGDPLAPPREGQVWVGIRDRFLVSVGASARREILARSLRLAWRGAAPVDADPEVKAFLDFSGRTLEEGDTVEYLYAPNGTFWVRYNAETPRTFRHAPLYRAMLGVEFGEDPDNPHSLDALAKALRDLVPQS